MIAIHNKELVQEYWHAISGKLKTPALVDRYVSDPELKGHIAFFEAAFPKYEMFADDFICEDDKVAVRGHFKGIHKGELLGKAPTGKTVESSFTVIYQVKDEKIVKSWLETDLLKLMNQLK